MNVTPSVNTMERFACPGVSLTVDQNAILKNMKNFFFWKQIEESETRKRHIGGERKATIGDVADGVGLRSTRPQLNGYGADRLSVRAS